MQHRLANARDVGNFRTPAEPLLPRGARDSASAHGLRVPTLRERNLERLERFLGVHALQVMVRDATAGARASSPHAIVRSVSRVEALQLVADPSMSPGGALVEHVLAHGGGCVAAIVAGRVAGCTWHSPVDVPYMPGAIVRVPAGMNYLFKTYVRPEYRGQGFGRGLLEAAAACGRKQGCASSFALIAAYNGPSLAAARRAGQRAAGTLVVVKAAGVMTVRASRDVRDLGIGLYAP